MSETSDGRGGRRSANALDLLGWAAGFRPSPGRRRYSLAALLATGITGTLLVAPPVGAAEGAAFVGSLAIGDSLFWDGPFLEQGMLSGAPCELTAETCGAACEAQPACFEYGFSLLEPGHRLRLGIDVPNRDNRFCLDLFRPDGSGLFGPCTSTSSPAQSPVFSAEMFVLDPAPGTWRLRVSGTNVTDSVFHLRAKLEAPAAEPSPPVLRLPNLQVIPPHEFGFIAPAQQMTNWASPDDANVPLDVAGVHPLSCEADEVVEYGAVKCLRFSVGAQNAGDGPLLLQFSPLTDATGRAVMYQRLRYSDGTFAPDIEAGTYDFHETHGHYHYTDFSFLELFRVVDAEAGSLAKVGEGPKQGFCLSAQKMADFRHFVQDARTNVTSNCFDASARMALSKGWGDVYRWQRPGNYVEFGNNTDGLYVVLATADASQRLTETNETDNTGYALVRVTGDTVRLLERGYGRSPWDPSKQVVATPPSAAGLAEPSITDRLTDVRFMDRSTDGQGRVVRWQWDFGDGAGSREQSPSHRYAKLGTFSVTLDVRDEDGEHDRAAVAAITVANLPPAAAGAAEPQETDRLRSVRFTDASADADGGVIAWLWDFGDGSSSTERNPSHRYRDLGTFKVVLTVTDNDGGVGGAEIAKIKVKNIPPASHMSGQGSGANSLAEDIEANRVDPVTFADASTDADGEVVAWLWDFGDGASSEEQNPSHQYTQLGTFTVRLSVSDNDGGTGTGERTVRVVNLLPSAAFTVDPARPMVLALTDFLDASTDPDGEPAAWGWAFGDGDTAKGAQVSHRYLEGGWYGVRLTVVDNDGGTATTTTSVYVCSPGGDAATLLDPSHVRLEFEACIHASPDELPRLVPMGHSAGAGSAPALLWVVAAAAGLLHRRFNRR